jgi:hypothetical protein
MKAWLRNGYRVLLAAAFIGIGYLRDFLFVNINFALKRLRTGKEFEGHSFLEFLKDFDPGTLFASKFLLTGVFTVLNFLPGALLIHSLFARKRYLYWFAGLYATILLLSLIFYGGGHLIGEAKHGYSLARLFMGFLQSPVPTMIFLPLCWLHRRERG